MAKAINFVGERRKKLTQAQKQDQKILKIAINVLIGVFAIFLIVVGTRFYFVFRVKNIKDTASEVRNRILASEPVEKDYIIFAQKLKKLALFFGRREDKQKALVFFSEVFGPDVIVSGIDYSSSDEDVVSFTIKAPNVFVMERVFTVLEGTEVTSVYPNIRKSSMGRSATGNYTVDLAVVLAADEKAQAPTPSTTRQTDSEEPAAEEE